MVYKGMDIGTAKPKDEILQQYPHKLINLIRPDMVYSVGSFIEDVNIAIQDSINNDRVPLLIGGTMMYFNAFINGISNLPKANQVVRQEILTKAIRVGWQQMHEELREFDPDNYNLIKANDRRRIQRAFEVYILTRKPLSSFVTVKPSYNFEVSVFGLMPSDRNILHDTIEKRFYSMIEEGFVDEVMQLQKSYRLDATMPSMKSVGYRQILDYMLGRSSYNEMCSNTIVATRKLAKRQLTWLRNWPDLDTSSDTHDLYGKISKKINEYCI